EEKKKAEEVTDEPESSEESQPFKDKLVSGLSTAGSNIKKYTIIALTKIWIFLGLVWMYTKLFFRAAWKYTKIFFTWLFLSIKSLARKTVAGIRNINPNRVGTIVLGILLGGILGGLPFILMASPKLFDEIENSVGIYYLFAILFASLWMGMNIARVKSILEDEYYKDQAYYHMYLTVGALIALFVLTFVYMDYGITGPILGIISAISIGMILGLFIFVSQKREDQRLMGILNTGAKYSITLTLIHFVTTSFILPYIRILPIAQPVDHFVVIFSLLIYLLSLSNVLIGVRDSMVNRIAKYQEKRGDVRLSSLHLRDDYIKILAENGIRYTSDLENIKLEDLEAIEGLRRNDAQMIMRFVFDLDDDYFEEEEEE
ncbi:MAG: hypothetical protein INQ03_00005, partial [Candidatus Heimdallarchaeota archaeon]|nr:hypothetical protein [Candidatus Heimdallarchaeota archaeon]